MLVQRVLTGSVGVLLVLGATWLGGIWMALFFAVIAAVCTVEIGTMMHVRLTSAESILALVFVVLLVVWPQFENFWYVLLYVLLIVTVFRRQQFSFPAAAVLFAGALYSSYAFRNLLDLRPLSHGIGWVLIVFIAIWTTDTGAYFIGRAFGGRKLLPEVSPKKTVSGAVGGLIFSVICTVIAGGSFMGDLGQDWWRFAILGLVVSVAGQAGDLIESALKRHYEVKDSGWLLPGHGGLLDRFDSLLLAAPIAYHLVQWLFFTQW